MNKLLVVWLCLLSTVLLIGGVFADTDNTGPVDQKRLLSGEKQLLVNRIYENRQTTLQTNKSGTVSMVNHINELRQHTYDACKVMVGQALSGTITKNVALTQCKTMKTQMEETIKQMRKDMQSFRKNNREQTKKENKSLRQEVKNHTGSTGLRLEMKSLLSGKVISGERKELGENRVGNCIGTGLLLTGDSKCSHLNEWTMMGSGMKQGKMGGSAGGVRHETSNEFSHE